MENLDRYYEDRAHEIYSYIYSLCHNKAVTEDVVQETFYKAYLQLESLRDEGLKPWLFRIAHNTFIDHYRKERRALPQEPYYFRNRPSQESLEDQFLMSEKIREVFQQIENLPPQQKQALILSTIHHLSYQEIAHVLELTESSVKSLIFRARATLKKRMPTATFTQG